MEYFEKLEVGQIFGICAEQLTTIFFRNDRVFVLDDFNKEEILEDRFLLLQYLGNGICQEYYTSKFINLGFYDDEIKGFVLNGEKNSIMKVFNYPLTIRAITDETLGGFIVNSDFKKSFANNMGHEKEIIEAIERIEAVGIERLKEKMSNIVEEDYLLAYAENAMYNLENGIKVKIIGERRQNS